MTRRPAVNDHVRLTHDVPDQSLQRGQVGVICSLWFEPECAYEVEFESAEKSGQVRALLGEWEVQLEIEPQFNAGQVA